jgi:hypothetical protein
VLFEKEQRAISDSLNRMQFMTNHYSERRNDDLDLMDIVRNFASFIRNSAKIIIPFGLIGLLLGITLYVISPNQYISKLVLRSFVLTNQEHIQVIAGWNDLLRNKERALVAQTLNCDNEVINKLSRVTAEEIVKANPDGNLYGFIITVQVGDTSILNELQKGIIFGLENNEYVRERVAIKKANLKILINKVSDEIRKLDSVKANVENALRNNSDGKTSSFLIDAGDINNEIIQLNEKLLKYQEDLKFSNAVEVLQKFNKLSKPILPKKSTLLPLGLFTGLGIGYILYLWIYLKRKLLQHPHETRKTSQ